MPLSELKFSIRALVAAPLHTAASVGTWAIGVGATFAVFSILNAVLLKPLPFPEPDRIVYVQQNLPSEQDGPMSMLNLIALKDGLTGIDSIAGYQSTSFNVRIAKTAREYRGALVTSDFFSVLRTKPVMGRSFASNDVDGVVVISDSVWRDAFQGDPRIVGRTIMLNGQPETVIGVVSSSVMFPEATTHIWRLVTRAYPLLRLGPEYGFLRVIARLREGQGISPIQAQANVTAERLAREKPELYSGMKISVASFGDVWLAPARSEFRVLIAAAVSILIVAFVNTINLQMSRLLDRAPAFATRMALGASRGRIVLLLLTENMILSLAGGCCGLMLAYVGQGLLLKLVRLPVRVSQYSILDFRVIASLFGICLCMGAFGGLMCAIRGLNISALSVLNRGARGASAGRATRLFQKSLVVIEIAACYALIIAVLLITQSFQRLSSVHLGFDPHNLLIITVRLPDGKYPDQAQLLGAQRELMERIGRIRGVASVSVSSNTPLLGEFVNYFLIKGHAEVPISNRDTIGQASVSPGYFRNLGVSLLSGREFTEQDHQGGALVAVINQSMARRYWGNSDPIGSQVRHGVETEPTRWYTVVGVVQDVRYVMRLSPDPTLYTPFSQIPQDYDGVLGRPETFEVRTISKAQADLSAIRDAFNATDPTISYSIQSVDDIIDSSISQSRTQAILFNFFGVITAWLSGLGVFGVVSNLTKIERRANAIRLALGASPRRLSMYVLVDGARMLGLGLAFGLALSLLSKGVLQALLFEIDPIDPLSILIASAMLALISFAALFAPSRNAASIDPITVLKEA